MRFGGGGSLSGVFENVYHDAGGIVLRILFCLFINGSPI